MIFKNLLAINAVITVPMGFDCVLAPAQLLAAYGVSLPKTARLPKGGTGREFGLPTSDGGRTRKE